MTIDLKILQEENVFTEVINENIEQCSIEKLASPMVIRILQSMKVGEITSSVVRSDFVLEQDPGFFEKFPYLNKDKPIVVQLTLLKLLKVVDLYRDQTVMYYQRERGIGSASPYSDCVVTIRVRIVIQN